MTDTTGRYAPMPEPDYVWELPGSGRHIAYSEEQVKQVADATCALRSGTGAEWLAEHERLLALYVRACEHDYANNTRASRIDRVDTKTALMAHAAQRPQPNVAVNSASTTQVDVQSVGVLGDKAQRQQPEQAQAAQTDARAQTREHQIALREAYHIGKATEYFDARPQIDSTDRRRVFDAGFNAGWQAATAPLQARIAELAQRNERLQGEANQSEKLRGQLEALAGRDGLARIAELEAENAALRVDAERRKKALMIAREGYASERATGLPVLEQWRDRTIELIDAAMKEATK